jgi:NADH-quinone oxidoreductase subunit J
MEFLHYLLTLLFVITSVSIFISNNPVHSVLFLILSFCLAALILFMFEVEFLGLLFIMVYVGAVAILFLFVVMMINTKKIIRKDLSYLNYVTIIFFITILFIKLSFTFNQVFFNQNDDNVIFQYFKPITFEYLSNMEVLGQALYNNYNFIILIAGLILLIALIGCIRLTIDFKENKKLNKSYKQLSKNSACVHKFN